MTKVDKKTIKTKRRIRVVECWAMGLTLVETVKVMRDGGFRISTATAHRDRHSTTAQEYVDELIRRQLRDIALAELEQKLNYRDKLLGKLVPQKIEAFQRTEIEQHVTIDATEDEDEILSKAAAILTRKRKSASIH